MNSKMNLDLHSVDDEKLKTPGQMAMRSLVSALPEEEVSMAWRSSLNQQLMQVAAKKQRRRRFLWVASPIAGLSFVSALAFVVMLQPFGHKPLAAPDHGVESAILADHHASMILGDMTSAGLNSTEVSTEANAKDPDEGIWNESDVESL